jgi:hypothetical protein
MSHPRFRTFHALRIKGFAKTETIAEVADVHPDEAHEHLKELLERQLATYREARGLWSLTPAGREAHKEELAQDVAATNAHAHLSENYHAFLALNERFKELCGQWQLRDGEPNDHTDEAYDSAVVQQLVALNAEAQPVVHEIGVAVPRFAPYANRLEQTCRAVVGGDTKMFTGVMCGSYHDVWMELHEDLILSQGIDRAAEGSF